jgi:hypothetical protein
VTLAGGAGEQSVDRTNRSCRLQLSRRRGGPDLARKQLLDLLAQNSWCALREVPSEDRQRLIRYIDSEPDVEVPPICMGRFTGTERQPSTAAKQINDSEGPKRAVAGGPPAARHPWEAAEYLSSACGS